VPEGDGGGLAADGDLAECLALGGAGLGGEVELRLLELGDGVEEIVHADGEDEGVVNGGGVDEGFVGGEEILAGLLPLGIDAGLGGRGDGEDEEEKEFACHIFLRLLLKQEMGFGGLWGERQRPGAKAPFLYNLIQGPEGPCSLRVVALRRCVRIRAEEA